MARSGGHDEILQAEHLGLVPDVPPTLVRPGDRRLLEVRDPEDGGELVRRGAASVPLDRAAVAVERRHVAVPAPPEVAVGAEEAVGAGAAVAEDGPGGVAGGAERGARVAGADRVGGVHEAVAGQAEPGAVGPAVHHRRRAAAVVAGRRRVAAGELLVHDRQLPVLSLVLLTHVIDRIGWGWTGRHWWRGMVGAW